MRNKMLPIIVASAAGFAAAPGALGFRPPPSSSGAPPVNTSGLTAFPNLEPVGVSSFRGLGFLPDAGAAGSVALGVSSDGRVVIGQGKIGAGTVAFRWSAATGMQSLGDLPGGDVFSTASATNADGSVVVGWSTSATSSPYFEAFRWDARNGMVSLGALPSFIVLSQANAVSADGSTVVGLTRSGFDIVGFRWTQATGMIPIGPIPGGQSPTSATAITPNGNTIYGYGFNGAGTVAWQWTAAGGLVSFGELAGGAVFAAPYAAAADGNTCVGTSSSATSGNASEAFRRQRGTGWRALGDLPGGDYQSTSYGISADGWVVVGTGTTANGQEAFIWDPTRGMRNLREWLLASGAQGSEALKGWRLTSASGVSADGTVVVGHGTNPDGILEAFLVKIPPFCYANCDGSTSAPTLNAGDFGCFMTRFRAGEAYANCDGSTTAPALNAGDFLCFLDKFQTGCASPSDAQ